MPDYIVVRGLSYPPNRHASPGDIVGDLPAGDVAALREQGAVVLLTGDRAAAEARAKFIADVFKNAIASQDARDDTSPEDITTRSLPLYDEDPSLKPATAVAIARGDAAVATPNPKAKVYKDSVDEARAEKADKKAGS